MTIVPSDSLSIINPAMFTPSYSQVCSVARDVGGAFPWDISQNISANSAIRDLQVRVDHLSRELGTTMLGWPLSGDQCFSVDRLEKNLKDAMRAAIPEFALDHTQHNEFGNKHSNLVKMATLADVLDLPELNIPIPYGISTHQISTFLRKNAPQFFSKWEELKTLHQTCKGSEPFLNRPEVQNALRTIDAEIVRAFNEPKAVEDLDLPQKMLSWLKERENNGQFLMVRSTGAEDSKEAANAGGNVSKAYVLPTLSSLCSAIGDVVRSYVSTPSLQNRLNAGLNPFEEPLSLAVTTQELVGEPIGGSPNYEQIPISFVLFTQEPLYVGNEKFRAMRLSATYGHGESVVGNNGVATDTVLILRSEAKPDELYYLYNNQKKPIRLAPMQHGKEVALSKIPNPKMLQEKPALAPKQLLDIFRSGILMESFFDHPTDIEGVVIGDKVHFVQARPVNRKPMLPTYLDVLQSKGVVASLQAETLVSGQASVVTIENFQDVLYAPTLEEAERRFVVGEHKLIIVEQSEPENSHPVVNFSSLGIPCLYTSDLDGIKNLLAQIDEEHPLAACMQTGTLNIWDRQLAKLEDHVVEGFAVHPAKIGISLSVPQVVIGGQGALEVPEVLLKRIRSGADGLKALDELERHPQVVFLREQRAKFSEESPSPEIQKRLAILDHLDKQLSSAIDEMRSVLKQRPAERLHRLFHAKTLETLLKGSKTGFSLGQYSLSEVRPLYDSIQTLIEYQKELSFPAHCMDMLIAGQVAPEAFSHWKEFLLGLEPLIENKTISEARWNEFSDLVALLQDTEALPLWLTFFLNGSKESGSSESASHVQFDHLLNQITPQDKTFIKEVIDLQQSIRQLSSGIDRFGHPNSFAQAVQEYNQLPSIPPSAVKAASPIAKAIFYRVMVEKITLLDTAAKTLKMGREFDPIEKVELFKKLLVPYYHMMRELAEKIVPHGAIPMHPQKSLYYYLENIQKILDSLSTENPEQLSPSADFSVSAAMLGGGTRFVDEYLPKTLEDMLTLLHQNSLACINVLNQLLIPNDQFQKALLPKAVKDVVSEIEQREWGRKGVQRIGIELNRDEISLRYNVPLRDHSGQLAISYDSASKEMILKGQFLGETEQRRWERIANWISMLQDTGVYAPKRPFLQGTNEITFYWKIDPQKISQVLEDYDAMAEYSIDMTDRSLPNLFVRLQDDPAKLNEFIEKIFEDPNPKYLMFYKQYVAAGETRYIPQVIEAAITNVKHKDVQVQEDSLTLLLELVKHGWGFDAAIDAIKMHIGHETRMILNKIQKAIRNSDVLRLLKELVKQGQGFEMAIEVAKISMGNPHWYVRLPALELFQTLFKKNQGFEEAIEAAKTNLKHTDLEIQIDSLILLLELVTHGRGFETAIEVASINVQNNKGSGTLKILALKLFQELVKQGRGFESATEAAKINIRDKNDRVIRASLNLLQELVKQGHGCDETVIEAACANIQDGISEVIEDTFTFLEELIRRGQNIEIISKVAKNLARNSLQQAREAGFKLLNMLAQSGYGFRLLFPPQY